MSWTKIFGSNGENTHWKVLYGNSDNKIVINGIPSNYNCYYVDGFRSRVYKQDNLIKVEEETDFFQNSCDLWNDIRRYRNDYLAHANPIEIEGGNITFPYMFPIYKTLIEFSNILCEIDKKARLSLFPDNTIGQNYKVQRDNLKNRVAKNIQELFV